MQTSLQIQLISHFDVRSFRPKTSPTNATMLLVSSNSHLPSSSVSHSSGWFFNFLYRSSHVVQSHSADVCLVTSNNKQRKREMTTKKANKQTTFGVRFFLVMMASRCINACRIARLPVRYDVHTLHHRKIIRINYFEAAFSCALTRHIRSCLTEPKLAPKRNPLPST